MVVDHLGLHCHPELVAVLIENAALAEQGVQKRAICSNAQLELVEVVGVYRRFRR